MSVDQKLIYQEVVTLGPDRLCEWLTRPRADLVDVTAPLVQRATAFLYPALLGAYHDGFKSLGVLPHYINLAFLQDIDEGDYPASIKDAAAAAVRLVNEVVAATPSSDGYALYDQAMFMPLMRLRAIGMVSPEDLSGVRDCSVNLLPHVTEILSTENLIPPSFPVLIWAGSLNRMNAAIRAF
jgi:hypothetical protein